MFFLKQARMVVQVTLATNECHVLKWAVDSLHDYLVGRSFTVVTDHQPLQWLHKLKGTNHCITRCYFALQSYSFHVELQSLEVSEMGGGGVM